MIRRPPSSPLFPYPTLFRSAIRASATAVASAVTSAAAERPLEARARVAADAGGVAREIFTRSARAPNARGTSLAGEENHVDRKSTRLNSSHDQISYAVFCLK